MKTISLTELNLPEDVIDNAWDDNIPLHGELTGKEINGVKYTMACLPERKDYPISNWL